MPLVRIANYTLLDDSQANFKHGNLTTQSGNKTSMNNVTTIPFNFRVFANVVQKHNLTLFRHPILNNRRVIQLLAQLVSESLLVRVWLP